MENISAMQLLNLWSELWQAYYDDNKYGGDTAEIYAHTLMEHNPTLDSFYRDVETFYPHRMETYTRAAYALHRVCVLFEERTSADVMIDGMALAAWMQGVIAGDILFEHRVHVKVVW